MEMERPPGEDLQGNQGMVSPHPMPAEILEDPPLQPLWLQTVFLPGVAIHNPSHQVSRLTLHKDVLHNPRRPELLPAAPLSEHPEPAKLTRPRTFQLLFPKPMAMPEPTSSTQSPRRVTNAPTLSPDQEWTLLVSLVKSWVATPKKKRNQNNLLFLVLVS
jgi:hypothetical protein